MLGMLIAKDKQESFNRKAVKRALVHQPTMAGTTNHIGRCLDLYADPGSWSFPGTDVNWCFKTMFTVKGKRYMLVGYWRYQPGAKESKDIALCNVSGPKGSFMRPPIATFGPGLDFTAVNDVFKQL